MSEVVAGVVARAMETGTILLLATLGEIYAERSGVLNLGVEGLMIMGALTSFMAAHSSGSIIFGIAVALIVGALMSLLHAVLSVSLRVNQVVSGLSIYILGIGLSGFLGKGLVGVPAPRLPLLSDPAAEATLSSLPVIGPSLVRILLGHNAFVYISLALALVMWFLLFRTRWGLNIRSVGENPSMADSLGVNVFRIRYLAVMVGGSLASLAGAYFMHGIIGGWTEGPANTPITGGRGWIAIALVILAAWSPVRAIFGAYLFGGVEASTFTLQTYGFSPQFLAMLPYILAILVLVAFSVETVRKRIGVPSSLGVPYSREP